MTRQHPWCYLVPILLIIVMATTAGAQNAAPKGKGITPQQVNQSIDRGVQYLKSKQNRNGGWTEQTGYPGGITSLCTLALLEAGLPKTDPAVKKAMDYLRGIEPEMTYVLALQTLVFCKVDPRKDLPLIKRNVVTLQRIQVKSGRNTGGWAYSETLSTGDPSNTQFALLALDAAERVGLRCSDQVWRSALVYWQSRQMDNGGWSYVPRNPATGSMTCAGISSVFLASRMLHTGDALVENDGTVICCRKHENEKSLLQGFSWMRNNFTVRSNPGSSSLRSRTNLLYYLYALERIGRFTGRRYIGEHDWYREGAEQLLAHQDKLQGRWIGVGIGETNPLVGTSFGLLFLAKGRRPVLIAKLRHGPGDDWHLHREDIANLTRFVERRWKRDMTWQTINPKAASVEDLLGSPVLYISGREGLEFTATEKKKLKQYVENGGFLFIESCRSCCGGGRFDKEVQTLLKELFPKSPMRLLPPEHPIWHAEMKVAPEYVRPLYGIDACCRTSVVYSPDNLSCYWELDRVNRRKDYPKEVAAEIEACNAMGANVLAYATGRELRDKLDTPKLVAVDPDKGRPPRGLVRVAKLKHAGGSDDAPAALNNLLALVRQESKIPIRVQAPLISPTGDNLVDFPITFIHGRRGFKLSAAERKTLETYIKRGGFLFGDSICADKTFTDALRREIKAVFPGATWKRIPADDPLFTKEFRGYDIRKVTLRDPQYREEGKPMSVKPIKMAPRLEGLYIDGRWAIIFSPYDISCAMENGRSLACKGYIRDDAAKIGTNIILYALQQ